ncbi:hypothetical protein DFH06DRAFT_1137339 [Mycena polygramma]|nr:hypothetical protein DFH06DRAFT_1137339 [Mycena polygramma]
MRFGVLAEKLLLKPDLRWAGKGLHQTAQETAPTLAADNHAGHVWMKLTQSTGLEWVSRTRVGQARSVAQEAVPQLLTSLSLPLVHSYERKEAFVPYSRVKSIVHSDLHSQLLGESLTPSLVGRRRSCEPHGGGLATVQHPYIHSIEPQTHHSPLVSRRAWKPSTQDSIGPIRLQNKKRSNDKSTIR